MRWLLLLLMICGLPLPASAIVINEIMYNPAGSDSYTEWLELYNNDSAAISLDGWTICDKTLLKGYINNSDGETYRDISFELIPEGYAIITDGESGTQVYDTLNITDSSLALHISASSICGELDNAMYTITLKDSSGSLIDALTYDDNWGGDGNDYSLSRISASEPTNDSANWYESFEGHGTPGRENFLQHDLFITSDSNATTEYGEQPIYEFMPIKFTADILNAGLNNEIAKIYLLENFTILDYAEANIPRFEWLDINLYADGKPAGNYSFVLYVENQDNTTMHSRELNFSVEPKIPGDVNISVFQWIVYIQPEDAISEINFILQPKYVKSEILNGNASGVQESWSFEDEVIDAVDFGAYEFCAGITESYNYEDTNLENNFACDNFTIAPDAKYHRIKAWADKEVYDLNQTLFWSAEIFLPENLSTTSGNLTIVLEKKKASGKPQTVLVLANQTLDYADVITYTGNFTLPENLIEGIYRIRAKFTYDNNYIYSEDDATFWVNGLKDLGPATLAILSLTDNLKFGDFGIILAKFFSGNYNYNAVRFLAYGYPSQVLMDLAGSSVAASDWAASTAVSLANVSRGQEIYVAVPALLKQNCKSDYADGTYRARLRAFNGSSALATIDLNLSIAGREEIFCPVASKSSSAVSATTMAAIKSAKELEIEILNHTKTAKQGETIKTKVKLVSNSNKSISAEIYSYAYQGSALASEGGWTGNKQAIELKPLASKTIELENRIKPGAGPGAYSLRVRLTIDEKKYDATTPIEILLNPYANTSGKSGEIMSFYARAKVLAPGKEIKLYANVKNAENRSQSFELKLENKVERITLAAKKSKTINLTATIPDTEQANYEILLLQDSKIIDSKNLTLQISAGDKRDLVTGAFAGIENAEVQWSTKSGANTAAILFSAALLILCLCLLATAVNFKKQQD